MESKVGVGVLPAPLLGCPTSMSQQWWGPWDGVNKDSQDAPSSGTRWVAGQQHRARRKLEIQRSAWGSSAVEGRRAAQDRGPHESPLHLVGLPAGSPPHSGSAPSQVTHKGSV